MAWKGDGSGRKDSERAGISGGRGSSGVQGGRNDALASERSRLRAMGVDTITPKYSWDDASMSDFSIVGGGLRGLFDTIQSGNTYAGRTPQGLQGGYSSDGGAKGLQYRPGVEPGSAQYWMSLGVDPYMAQQWASGRMMGGTTPVRMQELEAKARQQSRPAAPQQPQGLTWKPQTWGPTQINVPGAYDYGVNLDSWKYFG